jgi:AcrR family transcriptional regulator
MVEQTQGTVGGVSVEGMPAWQFARRERIVKAALRALESQEYEQIQIRDVAQTAEVALGTLYRYFSSKEHLYAAVLQEWAAFEQPRRAAPAKLAPSDRVRQRIYKIIRAFERQPRFYKVYVLLRTSADPNANALLAEFGASAQASLASEFESFTPDEARDAAIMLWSIINTMVTQAIYSGGTMREVRRVADRFIDLLSPRWRERD